MTSTSSGFVPPVPRSQAQIDELRRRVHAIDSWYHRIDLGDGIHTPGHLDMRRYLPHYSFPDSMKGMRVLDVGASTGFFAYEFERRGADEVVALELPSWGDHDWTPRYREDWERQRGTEAKVKADRDVMLDGFTVVGEALGSKRVRRVFQSIYELSAAKLGQFDVVFSGAMLMHVRDPILGLQKMREMCAPHGRLIISVSSLQTSSNEPVARFVGQWNQCNWWQPSPACLDAMLECCDFTRIEHRSHYVLENVTGEFRDPTYVCHALPRRVDQR